MGIPERSCRTRGLRHSPRCQQYLRLIAKSQLQSVRLCQQRSCRTRRTNSYRGPFQVRKIHSRYPRSSGDRSRLEALRSRHSTRRPHCHSSGMGRQHSHLPRSPQRSLESESLSREKRFGPRRMNLLTLQRTMAKVVMHPLTNSEHMSKRAPSGETMAQHAAKFIKPNDRLTSFERLEIYYRQYWWRLMSSL